MLETIDICSLKHLMKSIYRNLHLFNIIQGEPPINQEKSSKINYRLSARVSFSTITPKKYPFMLLMINNASF